MELSAEVRLFWRDEPDGFAAWFWDAAVHGYSAGGGLEPRTDIYLLDSQQPELGIKLRGGESIVEIKGLVAVHDEAIQIDGMTLAAEIWSKWQSRSVVIDAAKTYPVQKTKWWRRFLTAHSAPFEIALSPDEQPISDPLTSVGCTVELTQITDPSGGVWWSVAFASFGPLHSLESSLSRTVTVFLQRRDRPDMSDGLAASYPKWIANNIALRAVKH